MKPKARLTLQEAYQAVARKGHLHPCRRYPAAHRGAHELNLRRAQVGFVYCCAFVMVTDPRDEDGVSLRRAILGYHSLQASCTSCTPRRTLSASSRSLRWSRQTSDALTLENASGTVHSWLSDSGVAWCNLHSHCSMSPAMVDLNRISVCYCIEPSKQVMD